jgi:DNA polymerase-4
MGFGTGFRGSLAQAVQAQAQAAWGGEVVERTIFLLDYDSYFARCMQQAYPPLRGQPVGIRGPAKGTAVIAASTEAKRRGVKVGMHFKLAERLCPDLVLVKADMDMYGEIATRSLQVLTRFTDRVEPFSIDEAFLDVTDLVPIFGDPHMLAQQIKRELRAEIGPYITCSIGIGPNKMLAKLVVDFHKPDGITHVTPATAPAVLGQIALTDICGIGARIARRLQRLGIYTVAQLGCFPREGLVREFGVLGHVYWLWGQGIDLTPVTPYHCQAPEKSMGHGVTLPEAVTTRRQLDGVIWRLCERVGRRLRRQEVQAKALALWVREDGFEAPHTWGGRRVLAHTTADTQAFFRVAQGLLPPGLPHPVRQVHVYVDALHRDGMQLSLLEDRVRQRRLQGALDTINDRFGDCTINRATALFDTFPLRTGPPGHGFCHRFAIDE